MFKRIQDQFGRRFGSSSARIKLGELFGADLRSLAVFRVVLAMVVLMDLAGRVDDLGVHYTSAGVLPGNVVKGNLYGWRWSINLLNDSLLFQSLVFGATALAALALLVGYRTRVMSIAVWALVFSIQVRNPLVLSAADAYIRLMLFWAMFLPLGAWWSVDRFRWGQSRVPVATRFVSVATAGLFLQIAFVYWFTAALKSDAVWRGDGTALYYAFGAEHVTRHLREFLHQFPSLLTVLSLSSLGLEIVVPVLLFSPVWTGPIRTIAALTIMMFQFGIFLTLDVGLFPWIGAFSMVCFFPSWFWDSALRRLRGSGRVFGPWPLTPGNAQPDAPRSSPYTNIAATFCLLFIFGWNMASVSRFSMPPGSLPVAYGLGIYQHWNMFAPRPPRSTLWYVYQGTLQSGREVDALAPITGDDPDLVQEVSWSQPSNIASDLYGDKYWRKYLSEVATSTRVDERDAFARFVCRSWNEQHVAPAERLVSLQVFVVIKRTLPDYEASEPIATSIYLAQCG